MADLRAFPSSAIDDRFGGMTLREYYAGQALVGMLAMLPHVSNITLASGGVRIDEATIADSAFALADAMVARAKRGDADGVSPE